jgi:uncharacterized protein (DUF488 family)
MQNIYTIGHGSRTIEEFISLLKLYQIKYVLDVRSMPYSKYFSHFNRENLKTALKQEDITYGFMGDTLGGRPSDVTCYNSEGKVDYEAVKTKSFFLEGINRLKNAYREGYRVALMCSESKPCECHRSKLIGTTLTDINIYLNHIDEKGDLKDQEEVMDELRVGFPETDLFGQSVLTSSRRAYL